MKILKVTICYLIFVVFYQHSSCTDLNNQSVVKVQKEQKHFLTLKANPLYLSKSLNSKQKIHFPFQRIFALSTSLPSSLSKSIVDFSPTSIKLTQKKHSNYIQFSAKSIKNQHQDQIQGVPIRKNQGNYSLIDDLRTPFPIEISQIVVVNEKFIFLFIFPNKVVILEEIQRLIIIKNTYYIKEKQINKNGRLLTPESFSFYPLGQSHVLGYVQDSNQFLLFDTQNYTLLNNEAQIDNLEHVHSFSSGFDFFTAQRQGGFKHCRINLKEESLQKIAGFSTFDQIGFKDENNINTAKKEKLMIYDISFNQEVSEIYLLDKNIGVIRFKYNLSKTQNTLQNQTSTPFQKSSSLIIQQKGCQALDYIKNDRFVLICENRKRRFLVEAYFSKTTNKFIKEPPVFHNCYFDDLQINPQFYVAFQQTSVDIFWPSKRNFIPQLVHNKKHINLLGMQTFKIKSNKKGEMSLYSIRNNILVKYKILQQKYELNIGSTIPLYKSFNISVFGNCQTLFFSLNDKSKRYSMAFHEDKIDKLKNYITNKPNYDDSRQLLCQIIVPVRFQASEYIIENRAKFAFAAGIFIICILIAFSLICICFQKYKGMEKKAKQTLKKLEKEKNSVPQFVL